LLELLKSVMSLFMPSLDVCYQTARFQGLLPLMIHLLAAVQRLVLLVISAGNQHQ
jgi:hypothetical protein